MSQDILSHHLRDGPLRFEHKGLLIFDQDEHIIIEKHKERPL